jgi:transcriptional regulator with XRE-family HTH domain
VIDNIRYAYRMGVTFADRLNKLFEVVHPPGRGPHTSAEVISALQAEGLRVSAPYLSQLRTGQRTNPSADVMAAIARFFRIDPRYFTNDDQFLRLNRELEWLSTTRDEGVRAVARHIAGLSDTSIATLIRHADELRRQELDSVEGGN